MQPTVFPHNYDAFPSPFSHTVEVLLYITPNAEKMWSWKWDGPWEGVQGNMNGEERKTLKETAGVCWKRNGRRAARVLRWMGRSSFPPSPILLHHSHHPNKVWSWKKGGLEEKWSLLSETFYQGFHCCCKTDDTLTLCPLWLLRYRWLVQLQRPWNQELTVQLLFASNSLH